jgi:acetyl esterase/lipase
MMLDTGDSAHMRAARRRGDLLPAPPAVSELARDRVLAGVPVRVFTPPHPRGAFLHLHGGGFVYGSSRLQDDRLERLATRCEIVVISVEYRLAPEHPYPAALEDCEAVASWLVEKSTFESLAVGGESAGANLAVVTLLRLRDGLGATGFCAAALTAGLYDLTLAQVADGDPALTRADLGSLVDQYAGGASHDDPELSPLFADLTGLPPALIAAGARDPLLADSTRLAERWGGEAAPTIVDGPHSLDTSDLVGAFLSERVG